MRANGIHMLIATHFLFLLQASESPENETPSNMGGEMLYRSEGELVEISLHSRNILGYYPPFCSDKLELPNHYSH